jgi:hypothetical protein
MNQVGDLSGDGDVPSMPLGHYMDYRCVGRNPGGELRDGDAGKDADEQAS